MSAFGSPAPRFELYYAAVDKRTEQIVAVGMSAPGVLARRFRKNGIAEGLF
jgi:hypothetical protein